jgi:hypothetical protein
MCYLALRVTRSDTLELKRGHHLSGLCHCLKCIVVTVRADRDRMLDSRGANPGRTENVCRRFRTAVQVVQCGP